MVLVPETTRRTAGWAMVILLALAAMSVLVILRCYRKGDRITRDPFEDE